MFENLTPQMWGLIMTSTWQTLYMVFVAGFTAAFVGLPVGVALFVTRKGQIKENYSLNTTLSTIVNIGRSIPFVILLVAIIPFTKIVMGLFLGYKTFIGTSAAIVPLSVAAIPFYARLVEGALLEIPSGLTEAARAMGASHFQIIYKFFLPESLPSLLNGLTITLIAMVDYSAMAGVVGGGGLGYVGLQYGYQQYRPDILLVVVVILVIIVQIIQMVGDYLVNRCSKK